jgi:hypothetical protein
MQAGCAIWAFSSRAGGAGEGENKNQERSPFGLTQVE